MESPQVRAAKMLARLDRLPFSKWHRKLFIVAFLGIMFDATDFTFLGLPSRQFPKS